MAEQTNTEELDKMVNYFVECEERYWKDDYPEEGDPDDGVEEFRLMCNDMFAELKESLMLIGYKLSEKLESEWQKEKVTQIIKQIHDLGS